MTLSRRRFLSISAAFACAPRGATASTWQGYGFGAEISMTLRGPSDVTQKALVQAQSLLRKLEGQFSLFDKTSDLSQLNEVGYLRKPDANFLAVLRAADEIHSLSDGRFDPTVQSLWQAKTAGIDARPSSDWRQVRFNAESVTLAEGQTLTFNGIAQGYVTDQVTTLLRQLGLSDVLVNIGEFSALGGPWHLGISDPEYGVLATRKLTNGAIATSSTDAMHIGGGSHIMHREFEPQWSTVSVEAETATLADGLSTALILASARDITRIKALRSDIMRIIVVDFRGDLTTL